MMGRALLVVGWLATAGLVAAGVIGYGWTGPRELGLHLMVALITSLLLLFSHTWIMFYLIGTGKAIKTAVTEHDLEPELIEKTREFKNRSYPWLMLAMGVAMALFILGGGVATETLPAWTHQALFFVTLIVQVRTLLVERSVLVENERLMRSLDRRLTEIG